MTKTAITETGFAIKGMRCTTCATNIEKALYELPEIISAHVNFAEGRAQVTYRGALEREAIARAVKDKGYGVIFPKDQYDATPISRDYRLLVATIGALPLLIAMIFHIPIHGWVQLLLGLTVQAYPAYPFYVGAWRAIQNRQPNMDVLVVLGTTAAFLLSLVSLFGDAPELYFESGAVVIWFVLLGRHIEQRVLSRLHHSLSEYDRLLPETAMVLTGKSEKFEAIPTTAIIKGDIVLVAPGERIPVDGIVIDGQSDVNEAIVTGEAMPIFKKEGGAVISGSLNVSGSLKIRAESSAETSTIARIRQSVVDARMSRMPLQAMADRISFVLVPVVLVLALLVWLAWGLFGGDFGEALLYAVSVLVVACPCALGLATPLATAVGIHAAANKGILFKSAQVMEATAALERVYFDKTGVLTKGEPAVIEAVPLACVPSELLAIAASLESLSRHPLAQAVVRHAQREGLGVEPVKYFSEQPGAGVSGRIGGREVIGGNRPFMEQHKIPLGEAGSEVERLEKEGYTLIWVAEYHPTRQLLGVLALHDPVRESASGAVRLLRKLRVRSLMLSGDRIAAARSVAKAAGIRSVGAEASPDEKRSEVERSREEAYTAMVGDGINDAPALAAADVAYTLIKGGAGWAKQEASVLLLHDDLRLIPASIAIARYTRQKIYQNLGWAFAYNALALPMAALGQLTPMMAGLAMALSSLTVVLNSGFYALAASFQKQRDPVS